MPTRSLIRSRAARWLVWLACWTLLGLSFASQFYISSAKAGLEVTWRQAITYALGDWYVFAVLSLPAAWLARRYALEPGNWLSRLAVHLAASVVFSLAYMVLRGGLGAAQSGAEFSEAFRPLLVKTWHFNLLIYWVVLAVTHAFAYYRKFRERELRATELERSLAEAKLQALQMQLNPHFLFNALNSISALMHKDVEAADRMVARLSQLLRAALDTSDEQEVELRKEVQLLNLYLGIEKIRFGDRLEVRLELPPETLEARVPNLILQPLVENAIRHGIEPRRRRGVIEVISAKQDGWLSLLVRDNGSGLPKEGCFREGVGLANTRERLRELYGENHQVALSNSEAGGLQVVLSFPFRNGGSS
jgi:signal transduction histidine kinase